MIEDIIKGLKKNKIKDYEIFVSENRSTSLDTKKDIFDKKEYDFDKGYGLRIVKNKRIGFVYLSDKKQINSAIKTAIRNSKIRPKTDFIFQNKNPRIKVQTYDKKVIDLEEIEMKDLIVGMLNNIKKKNIRPISCSIGKTISNIQIINSEGLDCDQIETGISAASYCSKGKTGSEYYEGYKINKKEIINTGNIAAKRAVENSKSKRIEPYSLPVILEQEALLRIIDELLLTQMTGDKKHHKSSFLVGKENKKIAVKELTLYEDPFSEAYSKTNFDGEGTEDDISVLINKGRFTGFVYDRETAALDTVEKDGFCSRSDYKTKPGIGFSNILIKPGKIRNLENLFKEYMVIGDIFGLHTANTTTGDFAVTVGRGYVVIKKKKQFIQGNILSGNVYELIKNIKGIERQTKMRGSYILPRIAVGGLLLS